MRPLRLLLAGILVGALAVAGCGAARELPPSAPSHLSEKPLPDFKRRTLDGSTIDTKALRGQLVVVKFFARYCKPCKKTLPAAERLHQERPEVAFVGISEDEYESETRELIEKYSLTFPVIRDASNVLAGRFRVSDMPVTFVADAQGVVRWVGGPAQGERDLKAALAALQ